MRLNTLLLVAGLLALVFGLGFLLIPAALLPVYGIDPAAPTVLMSRFFGGTLLQLGTALYLLRETREPGTQRGLMLAGVLGSLVGLAVALLGQVGGLVNAMGWSTVVIFAGLLVGYAMCLKAGPVTR